jgi:class I fructose-bisphosphate aldolase
MAAIDRIREYLGDEADDLLNHKATGIPKENLHLPGPDFLDRVVAASDRPSPVLTQLHRLFHTGRLAGTGYVSVLPVDQGIEHSGAASFAPNPAYFDPENIIRLAIAGGCNACASTLGVLGAVSRKYAHKIPFIVKLNHSELLTYPNSYDQTMFASVDQAYQLGAAAVGATIYYGSTECRRQIQEVSAAFKQAHERGMFTVLWCYLRNNAFKTKEADYHLAADLTGQANHLGVTIEADIVKQKAPQCNRGYQAMAKEQKYGRTHDRVYEELCTDHPIEWTRWQVVNCYMGRVPMINSGGASGQNDFAEVTRTAVVNKRAGGTGLITGRKAFQRPMDKGAKLLSAVQDVYLCDDVTVA